MSPEARAHYLAQQLVQSRQDLSSAHADLRNARSERDSLRAELSRARARIEELEAQTAEKTPISEPVRAIDHDLELKLRGRINELEAALSNARASSAPPADSDLKVLRGIGPKFEKALKAEGVSSVRQIAEWSDADVAAFAGRLGVRPERIRKDDWVGQAQRIFEKS